MAKEMEIMVIKIIVNATHKGGEGKTTNSIMLAEYCAFILNLKTLIIDMDPQANLSGRYLAMEYDQAYEGGKLPPIHPEYDPNTDEGWDGRSTIADIFYGKEVYPYPTPVANIEILPSSSVKLQEAEAVTKNEVLEKVHLQLKRFLSLPEIGETYQVVIIDTPPSKGPLTIAAIKASSHVVIPAQMEQFSIDGIYGMLQLWKQESFSRDKNNPINLVGILPNQLRDIKLHKDLLEAIKGTKGISDYVMPLSIKKRAIYTEILATDADPKSIFELNKQHVARQEYEKVCQYITNKVFNHG